MQMIKKLCDFIIPSKEPKTRLSKAFADWETHPSLLAGLRGLEDYNNWVSEVVLPIAFQWIEEHKAEVYATVAKENKDDVGVVIASAHRLVQELEVYRKGLKAAHAYEAAVKDGTWNPSTINPVWTKITQEMRESAQENSKKADDMLGKQNGSQSTWTSEKKDRELSA